MRLNEAIASAKEQLHSILNLDIANVIAVSKLDDGWNVKIDLIERRAIPDTMDIMGTYEVILDNFGSIVKYERKNQHKRMDLEEIVE
jgi:hypothetical protein